MKPFATFYAVLVFLFFNNKIFAQDKCGTVPYMQQLYQQHKIDPLQVENWIAKKRLQQKNSPNQKNQNGVYQIPVVVHVIHKGEPVGTGVNISDEQILSQIDVLNKDFRRENLDANLTPSIFQPLAAGMSIEFILARQDPDGLFSDGIVRKQGTRSVWGFTTEAELKSQSFWPSEDYLNIWVTDLAGTLLGFAQFPFTTLPGLEGEPNIAATDGVVIDYEVFGSIDDGPFILDPQFNKGRTTTHEVGHYFGLRHIWGDDDGCTESDYVDDTPNQGSDTSGCPAHPQSSCGGVKMFQNYMDYTDDECMNLFTAGQVERMQIILDDETVPRRNSLLTSPGLEFPPGFTNDVSLREIINPTPVTCIADELKIKIQNRGADPLTSCQITYQIDNQNPTTIVPTFNPAINTSEVRELIISLNTIQDGAHTIEVNVDLPNGNVDNAPSNNTLVKNFIINNTQEKAPLNERFTSDFASLKWLNVNPTGNLSWQSVNTNYETSAFYSNTTSTSQSTAWLVSPVIDFSTGLNAAIRFQYSFRDAQNGNEKFSLYYSDDCGLAYQSVLVNLTNSRTSTVASTIEDWEEQLIELPALIGVEKARIALAYSSNVSNGFYIDNIQIYDEAIGIKLEPEIAFLAYPDNDGNINVTLNLPDKNPGFIEVFDLMGRSIASQSYDDALNQTITLSTKPISFGIYIVRVQSTGKQYTQRILINPR